MTVYKGDTNFIIGRIYLPNTTIKKSIIYLHAKKKIPIEQIEHSLNPAHKSSIMLFLERVYGIPDQETFFRILEEGILPDLRAATTLDTVSKVGDHFGCLETITLVVGNGDHNLVSGVRLVARSQQ
jgi:hypothetical protein